MLRVALFALLTLVGAGCATHSAMRGSVVMRVNNSDAHVCLGEGEVAVGDTVNLIHHDCATKNNEKPWVGAAGDRCRRQVVGTGQVVEVLNSHYSIVRFKGGVAFVEGDTIEKAK
jgi:hypothetical protein